MVQEKKGKIDFQDGGHLGFPIRMILAIFHLQVTLVLPTKFQVIWPFGSGGEAQNRFFKIAAMVTILDFRLKLALFDLQVTQRLPSKSQVNWTFNSREESKIDFQDGGHLGFLIGTVLAIFDLQVTLMLPIKF